MRTLNGFVALFAGVVLFGQMPAPASAEAAAGSPDATRTLDGAQLPPPPLPFGGKIERDALHSTPWWSPRVVPPKDAPNVLLIITDDAGFAVPSTFGGVIPRMS